MSTRGSDWLRENWSGEGRFVREEDLKQIIELARADGIDLTHWWIRGQPAPEAILGTFQVKPEEASRVVGELLGARLRFRLDVFPYGIVDPEVVHIRFESGGLGGR
jgi:hypothetical protein